MAVSITLYSAYLKRLNKSTLVYISVLLLKDMHNLLTVLHYLTLSQRCRETQCYDKPLKLVRTKKKKKILLQISFAISATSASVL